MSFYTRILLFFFMMIAQIVGQAQSERALASDSFVNSVGVCIHLHNGHTLYYDNFPFIRRALVTLGVRHVREGLIDTQTKEFYDRLNELGKLGIKGLYITDPAFSPQLLKEWPSRVSHSFEAYEGPNEYDKKADWLATLRQAVPLLYSSAKRGVAPTALVAGPALTMTASFNSLGDISRFIDIGNLHNYYAGRNPGNKGWGQEDKEGNRYGSIAYSIDNIRRVAGNKPVWVTETGYTNQLNYENYVTEEVAAVYMPRLLLEHWVSGIRRTYIYELLSSGGEDFGLIRSDGTYKPVFNAVSSLLKLLADQGPTFTPETLEYSIAGASPDLHHLLMQKHDGTYYLALWIEAMSYDPDKHVKINVSPYTVTLSSPHRLSDIVTYQWSASGNLAQNDLNAGTKIQLVVSDKLLIVKLNKSK